MFVAKAGPLDKGPVGACAEQSTTSGGRDLARRLFALKEKPLAAVALAFVLANALDEAETACFTDQELAALSGLSDRGVRHAKRWLEDQGLVFVWARGSRACATRYGVKPAPPRVLEDELVLPAAHPTSDPIVREYVWRLTDGKCVYCGVTLIRGGAATDEDKDHTFHVDHVIPASAGGPDHVNNYVPSCARCNLSKSAGHVLRFVRLAASPGLSGVDNG